MGKAKVKLEKDLLEKVKKFAQMAGYSSSEEFITHCLEKEIAKLEESDSEEEVRKKVGNAFTGGRGSAREQKELGGTPDVCSVFKYFFMVFILDNNELSAVKNECLNGERLCGECKSVLQEKILKFLRNHQKKREKARNMLEKYWISEKIDLKQLINK